LEIVVNNEFQGDLISIQLKSTEKIDWLKSENNCDNKIGYFSGIQTSTINYWMGIQIPVFLCVVELSSRRVYCVNVKHQVRQKYDKFLQQDTVSFHINSVFDLRSKDGIALLYLIYLRERRYDDFAHYLQSLVIHWKQYLEFVDSNMGRDFFLDVEDDRKILMTHLYETCQFITEQLGHQCSQTSLHERFKRDSEIFKTRDGDLHEGTLTEILYELRPLFVKTLQEVISLVIEKEESYWLNNHYVLFHYCLHNEDYIKSVLKLDSVL
jgi:hypothetical protein